MPCLPMRGTLVAAAAAALVLWPVGACPAAAERTLVFPGGKPLYPAYHADPRQPRLEVAGAVLDGEVPGTSDGRILTNTGIRVALFVVEGETTDAPAFSFDVEGGLFHRFDTGRSFDSVAWDGAYNFFGTCRWSPDLAFRAGFKHLSAHLGDEYIEQHGTRRINYSRTALAAGVAWRPAAGLTFYAEPGWGYQRGNDRQEPWAIEGGVQYQGRYALWGGRAAPYGGLHVASFEESSWDPGTSLRVGLVLPDRQDSSRLRLWLAAYRGRALPAELALEHDERQLSAGLSIDFF